MSVVRGTYNYQIIISKPKIEEKHMCYYEECQFRKYYIITHRIVILEWQSCGIILSGPAELGEQWWNVSPLIYELFIPFLFFVLVNEVTKNENSLRDFLCNVFRLQGKTGKIKMKNNKKTNKLVLRNIFVFRNFCQSKWKTKNGMKSSIRGEQIWKWTINYYCSSLPNFWTFHHPWLLEPWERLGLHKEN